MLCLRLGGRSRLESQLSRRCAASRRPHTGRVPRAFWRACGALPLRSVAAAEHHAQHQLDPSKSSVLSFGECRGAAEGRRDWLTADQVAALYQLKLPLDWLRAYTEAHSEEISTGGHSLRFWARFGVMSELVDEAVRLRVRVRVLVLCCPIQQFSCHSRFEAGSRQSRNRHSVRLQGQGQRLCCAHCGVPVRL